MNRTRALKSHVLSVVCLTLFLPAVLAGAEINRAEIAVDPGAVINPRIQGFGWVFCAIDGASSGPNTEERAKAWRKWYGFGPGSFARVCIHNMTVEPFNDNGDPWKANLEDGFIFSSNWTSRPEINDLSLSPYYKGTKFYKGLSMKTRMNTTSQKGTGDYDFFVNVWKGVEEIIKFCEENDIDVMLDPYHIGRYCDPHYNPYCWLGETQYGQTHETSPNYEEDCAGPKLDTVNGSPWNDYPYNLEELGENLAAMVYYFKVVKGYKCVKWICGVNEPNCTWGSTSICDLGWKQALLNLYASIDRHLKNFNGQDLKKTTGIQTITNICNYQTSPEDVTWLLKNKNNDGSPAVKGDLLFDTLGEGGGGWRCSYDFGKPDTNMEEHVANMVTVLENIKAADSDGVIEKLYSTETHAGPDPATTLKAKFLAEVEQAIRLANIGVKGHVTWDSRYAFMGWMQKPKLALWGYGFLPRYVKKNSDVLKTTITGNIKDNTTVWKNLGHINEGDHGLFTEAVREAQRIWPAMFRSPEGEYSLFVVNDSQRPAELTVHVPSQEQLKLKMFYIYDANPEKPTDESGAGIHPYNTGSVTDSVPENGQYNVSFAGGKTKIVSRVPGASIVVFTELNVPPFVE